MLMPCSGVQFLYSRLVLGGNAFIVGHASPSVVVCSSFNLYLKFLVLCSSEFGNYQHWYESFDDSRLICAEELMITLVMLEKQS